MRRPVNPTTSLDDCEYHRGGWALSAYRCKPGCIDASEPHKPWLTHVR